VVLRLNRGMNRNVNRLSGLPEAALSAGERAYRLVPPAIVRELTDLLGGATVAALGGVKSPRSVYQWLSGERQPERLETLRFALQMAYMLRFLGETEETVRAWLTGPNVRLEGATPVSLLSVDPVTTVGPRLMNALVAFVELPKKEP
jgi:hypothetical protein